MDRELPQTLDEVIAAKAEYRKHLAALPMPEKIRRLVEMQKRRAPIVARWGKKQVVWQLPPDDPAFDSVRKTYGGGPDSEN